MLKEKLFTRFDCFLDDPEAVEPEFEVLTVNITEALSAPYEIKLTVSSLKQHLIPRTFIKRTGRVILNFGYNKRYFYGIIGAFKQMHLSADSTGRPVSLYELCLYPQLWFLKFNKEYRIFQEKSTLDIIDQVLKENKVLHVTFPKLLKTSVLKHVDPVRNYCVQYGESDFDFISRLLEDRGFYYYFDHQATQHMLKLAFTQHDHTSCPVVDTIEIVDSDFKGNELNSILTHQISSKMQPKHQVIMDYNYHNASLEMVSHTQTVGDGGPMYTYPGGFNKMQDGHTKVKQLEDADDANEVMLSGRSAAPFFSPGFKFTLSGHQNPVFDEQEFTLETVTHAIVDPRFVGADDLVYSNTFTAFLSTASYRPELKTPKPKIHGTQTAIVIAPHGEEVWTDAQGRVKVQFHWNHRGYKTPIVLNSEQQQQYKKKQYAESEDDDDPSFHTRHKTMQDTIGTDDALAYTSIMSEEE